MTLVLAWYTKQGSENVLHIATDGRLSDPSNAAWAHATKIFRFGATNLFVAYCGDSHLSLIAITQGISLLPVTNNLSKTGLLGAKTRAIGEHIADILQTFPSGWGSRAELLLCGFDPCLGGIQVEHISLSRGKYQISHPLRGGARYLALGSGAAFARAKLGSGKDLGSRDFFGVLVKAINEPSLQSVGGVPQHVVLFTRKDDPSRDGVAISGINWHGKSTVFGIPLKFSSSMRNVVWRTHILTRARYLGSRQFRRAGWKPVPPRKVQVAPVPKVAP